jgi:hypothetical protein
MGSGSRARALGEEELWGMKMMGEHGWGWIGEISSLGWRR